MKLLASGVSCMVETQTPQLRHTPQLQCIARAIERNGSKFATFAFILCPSLILEIVTIPFFPLYLLNYIYRVQLYITLGIISPLMFILLICSLANIRYIDFKTLQFLSRSFVVHNLFLKSFHGLPLVLKIVEENGSALFSSQMFFQSEFIDKKGAPLYILVIHEGDILLLSHSSKVNN